MIRPKSIAQILAELVVEGGMPLKAVAITGELIAMDARISDYLNGPMKHGSLKDIELAAESYDALLKKAEGIGKDFLETRDRQALMNELVAVKDTMAALL
jgi:hypothetical protein